MNKFQEVLLDIDGKIAYAESTGNYVNKKELVHARKFVELSETTYNREDKDLCDGCRRGSFYECGCKPTIMLQGKVLECRGCRIDGKV